MVSWALSLSAPPIDLKKVTPMAITSANLTSVCYSFSDLMLIPALITYAISLEPERLSVTSVVWQVDKDDLIASSPSVVPRRGFAVIALPRGRVSVEFVLTNRSSRTGLGGGTLPRNGSPVIAGAWEGVPVDGALGVCNDTTGMSSVAPAPLMPRPSSPSTHPSDVSDRLPYRLPDGDFSDLPASQLVRNYHRLLSFCAADASLAGCLSTECLYYVRYEFWNDWRYMGGYGLFFNDWLPGSVAVAGVRRDFSEGCLGASWVLSSVDEMASGRFIRGNGKRFKRGGYLTGQIKERQRAGVIAGSSSSFPRVTEWACGWRRVSPG